MQKWFWAFGSGGRMCVGSNLAIYRVCPFHRFNAFIDMIKTEMKHIVAAIYSNFATTIFDDDGIEQLDAYTAPPKRRGLIIKLEQVQQ